MAADPNAADPKNEDDLDDLNDMMGSLPDPEMVKLLARIVDSKSPVSKPEEINPKNFTKNCGACAVQFDIYLKGGFSCAASKSDEQFGISEISKYYRNPAFPAKSVVAIMRWVVRDPSNRGIIWVRVEEGTTGHIFNVYNNNKNPTFYDAQRNKHHNQGTVENWANPKGKKQIALLFVVTNGKWSPDDF